MKMSKSVWIWDIIYTAWFSKESFTLLQSVPIPSGYLIWELVLVYGQLTLQSELMLKCLRPEQLVLIANSENPSSEIIGNDLSPIQPEWYVNNPTVRCAIDISQEPT